MKTSNLTSQVVITMSSEQANHLLAEQRNVFATFAAANQPQRVSTAKLIVCDAEVVFSFIMLLACIALVVLGTSHTGGLFIALTVLASILAVISILKIVEASLFISEQNAPVENETYKAATILNEIATEKEELEKELKEAEALLQAVATVAYVAPEHIKEHAQFIIQEGLTDDYVVFSIENDSKDLFGDIEYFALEEAPKMDSIYKIANEIYSFDSVAHDMDESGEHIVNDSLHYGIDLYIYAGDAQLIAPSHTTPRNNAVFNSLHKSMISICAMLRALIQRDGFLEVDGELITC